MGHAGVLTRGLMRALVRRETGQMTGYAREIRRTSTAANRFDNGLELDRRTLSSKCARTNDYDSGFQGQCR